MTVSIIGFACLLLLIFLRLPIAFAMGFVGIFGFFYLSDYNLVAALSMASRRVINTSQDYSLSVIPLFILMGNLVTRAGLSQELYKASYSFLGHLRGGLSMATVVACAPSPTNRNVSVRSIVKISTPAALRASAFARVCAISARRS